MRGTVARILQIESFGQTKFIVQEETPEKSRGDQNQRMRRRTARQREEPLAKAAVGAKFLKNPKASYAAEGIQNQIIDIGIPVVQKLAEFNSQRKEQAEHSDLTEARLFFPQNR